MKQTLLQRISRIALMLVVLMVSAQNAMAATGSNVFVYYDNPNGWANVNLYLYDDAGNNNAWPGVSMTYDPNLTINSKTGWWFYEAPAEFVNGYAIVNDGTGNQYPASGQPGIAMGGKTLVIEGTTPGTTDVVPASPITIYVQAATAPFLYAWDASGDPINGVWPGAQMKDQTVIDGVTYYYRTFARNPINIIFNNGAGTQTGNMEGITSSSFFTYDGGTGAAANKESIKLSTPYMTYCSIHDLDFSAVTGLKAYVASEIQEGTTTNNVMFTSVTSAPAGTGLLLVGTAGTGYDVPVAAAQAVVNNYLKGLTATTNVGATDGTNTNLILVDNSGNYQFAPLGAARDIAAGKAYLQLPTTWFSGAAAKSMNLLFDGKTTGIYKIEANQPADGEAYFNLMGVKVEKPAKGVYIHKGKKVVVK